MIYNIKPGFKIKLKQSFAEDWSLNPNKFYVVTSIVKSFDRIKYCIDATPKYPATSFTAFPERIEQVKGYFSDASA